MATTGWQAGVLAAALAFASPALAQSGGSASTGSGSMSGGSGSSSTAGATSAKVDKDLQEAAQKLHAANLAEVQGGQTAQQSAQSPEVKQYAQRMIDDHQKNDAELQQLAQSMGVSLQGDAFQKKQKKAQDDLQKVQGKSGAEFDKAYMKLMVDDHKKDVKEVEKAAKDAHKKGQSQLASFLDQTHQHLQMHLQEAQRIEKSVGKGGMGSASSRSGASGASSMGSGSSASPGGASSSDSASGASTGTTGSTGSPGSTGSSGTGGSAGTAGSDTGSGSGRGSSGGGSSSAGGTGGMGGGGGR